MSSSTRQPRIDCSDQMRPPQQQSNSSQPAAGPANSTGTVVVISGPSGVGKSTLCRHLVQRLGAVLSVSATTRSKSPHEQDGSDYYFLSRQEFQRRLQAGQFLEYAEYLGNLYGTPAEPVHRALQAGKTVLLELEVQGGIQIANRFADAILIYVLPAEPRVLTDRLQARRRDKLATIRQRLANADGEIRFARDCGKYRYFVVNDVLEETVDEIVQIIQNHRRQMVQPDPAKAAPAVAEDRTNHDRGPQE